MGGGGSITKKHNYQHVIINPGGQQSTEFPVTVTVNKCGRNVLKITDVSPCLTARDYKGYAGKKDMIAVIEERKEQDNEQRE